MYTVLVLVVLNFQLSSCEVSFEQPKQRPEACRGNDTGFASEHEVSEKFFKPYGNWQRPRLNSSESVLVNLSFGLNSIVDVLEKERTLLLNGYFGAVSSFHHFFIQSNNKKYHSFFSVGWISIEFGAIIFHTIVLITLFYLRPNCGSLIWPR